MKKINELPEILKLSEVAEIFRVSKSLIVKRVKEGKIPCIKISSRGDTRFKKEVIIDLIDKGL